MKRFLIRGGHVIDPATQTDDPRDILIDDGRIIDCKPSILSNDMPIIDAAGWIVTPGFIDIHTHLREPGYEDKETIATGTMAAAAGGFTAIACMANTNPVNDHAAVTRWILDQAASVGIVRVWPIAAVTLGLEGKSLTEMGELKAEGAVAFSDDGQPLPHARLVRSALEYSLMLDCPIIDHCEDRSLSAKGVMHEGFVSLNLGLTGNPAASEIITVQRDILLAEMTGGHIHIAHVSTAGAADTIRCARSKGIHVTAEVTPHHLVFTDQAIETNRYSTLYKVNPPLREDSDRNSLIDAIADGSIQAIATDHAPHELDAKRVEFNLAAPGIIGLETAIGAIAECLVRPGRITWKRLVELFTTGPAQILHRPVPALKPGEPAHLTLIDPDLVWTYHVEESRSKSRNSPFDGMTFHGGPVMTLVDGRIVYQRAMPSKDKRSEA